MNNFPIRVLSEKTGVAPTTLRAWERRYGLLSPERTPKGHRLYSPADVEIVKRIVKFLNENYTISKAINAIKQESLVQQSEQPVKQGISNDEHWVEFQNRFLSAIELFDENRLDAIYSEALSLYPIDLVSSQVLQPLLGVLGTRWQQRPAGIAEEHFFTSYLRNKVGARMHHASGQMQGSRLLLACLPGEYHELGSLLFGLSAMSRGYRILFLGADLPLAQINLVCQSTEIEGVILSAVNSNIQDSMVEQLEKLADSLPVPLMIGGMASNSLSTRDKSAIILLGGEHRYALQTLENTLPAYR